MASLTLSKLRSTGTAVLSSMPRGSPGFGNIGGNAAHSRSTSAGSSTASSQGHRGGSTARAELFQAEDSLFSFDFFGPSQQDPTELAGRPVEISSGDCSAEPLPATPAVVLPPPGLEDMVQSDDDASSRSGFLLEQPHLPLLNGSLKWHAPDFWTTGLTHGIDAGAADTTLKKLNVDAPAFTPSDQALNAHAPEFQPSLDDPIVQHSNSNSKLNVEAKPFEMPVNHVTASAMKIEVEDAWVSEATCLAGASMDAEPVFHLHGQSFAVEEMPYDLAFTNGGFDDVVGASTSWFGDETWGSVPTDAYAAVGAW